MSKHALPNTLPNCNQAWVPLEKLDGYLLSPTHAIGKSKAQFFLAHGYTQENATVLGGDLLKLIRNSDIIESSLSQFGVKYAVEGTIFTPKGTSVALRTIWIIEHDDECPRFVTAYPV